MSKTKNNTVAADSPAQAIKMLDDYNTDVVLLVQCCELALQHNLVNANIAGELKARVESVKSFNM